MTYRIVQWTTGNVGKRSVRAIALNPNLELVGCYAWSADKVGRDAGELCGIEPLGVKATNDVDTLLALKPDCVVYNPMFADVDEMCRILGAGINIVSTSEFVTGHFFGEGRERIATACKQGGSTIFGSGINPGFIQLFAIVSAGLSERVGLLQEQVTSELACPAGWAGRMSLCPGLTPKSSVTTSCGSRATATTV